MTPKEAALYALDEVAMRSWHLDAALAPKAPMMGRSVIVDASAKIWHTSGFAPEALRRAALDGAHAARLALKLRRRAALDTMRLDPGKREEEIAVTEYYKMWCVKAWARCMKLAASCR